MYKSFSIGKRPSLKDIEIKESPVVKLRQITSIAIIDDKPFAYINALTTLEYNVNELGDISDINAVASYDIIVCDIRGVGSTFGSTFGGAYLIGEIRNRFPDKYIIAFSGGQFDPTFKKFFDKCDASLKKDADIEEWTGVLDQAVSLLGSPIKRWLRARSVLIESGIDLFDVACLEIEFVKAISEKSPDELQKAFGSVGAKYDRDLLTDIGAGLGAFVGKLITNV